MQNAQNTEIQQRVINLVELYRTRVGVESKIAQEAKADCECWEKLNEEMAMEAFDAGESFFGGMYGEGSHTEVWIKHLKVNEQLLGHFYAEVAGENAEQDVLDQLLPDVYDKTIFTEEEESFLKLHFKEMVNYIILTPCDDNLKWVHRHDSKDAFTIPREVLELISSRVEIASGSKVYYPNTFFAQLANLFDGSTFYVDTMAYAWTRVATYANSVNTRELAECTMPQSYDAIVSYLPTISKDSETIKHLCDAYNNLPSGGKLILLCPSILLAEDSDSRYRNMLIEEAKSFAKRKKDSDMDDICASFRRMLVESQSIKEIIQLPRIMSSGTYCLLIAEKDQTDNSATLIDARTASNDIDTKHRKLSFDMAKFDAIMENDGKDPNTGLRKVVRVSTEYLSQHLLVPEVYTIERPSETEHPVPLSSLCTLESTSVRDVQFDLPEDTPWITMSDLTPLFTGDMNLSDIRKADCPNNPPFVEGSEDYAFDKGGKFIDTIWAQMDTKKGHHVLEYRQCTFLNGNTDAVLYERSEKHGIRVAVVQATGKPYAVSKGILVFCPKNSIDANSLAAILRMPIVSRQLTVYENYGVGTHLDDILVPTDKRVIGDELYRMKREKSVTNELGDKVQAMKTEYINEVRMRKHDMRPHMKQLNSAKNLMQYYVDNMDTIDDVKQNLNHQLIRFRDALSHLSDLIENLSDEEKFGKPERFSLTEYFEKMITESIHKEDILSFRVDSDAIGSYFTKQINDFREHMKAVLETKDKNILKEQFSFHQLSYVNIAPLDFDRMVQNIIENARKHGFTDPTRDDYMIWINLSVDEKRDMYIIDFMNNGTPLPEGMSKARYGIKGEKAGLTGGTGTGGYIVKSIVTHYGGDYDVFYKDGITTIRIYLPIATI